MTKEQFIAGCVMCGYCRKQTAKEYADTKVELTEDDFEVVYRIEQDQKSAEDRQKEKWHYWQGTKSTKTYRNRMMQTEREGS